MKTINLIPKSVSRELQLDLIAGQILNFLILGVLSLAIFFGLIIATVFYLKSELATQDKLITQQKETLSSSNTKELETRVSTLNKKIQVIKQIRANHYYWSEALEELANNFPADMSIDTMTMDRTTNKVEISGKADNRQAVLDFWTAMKSSAKFKDINFPLPNLNKESDGTFTFIFYVKPETIKH